MSFLQRVFHWPSKVRAGAIEQTVIHSSVDVDVILMNSWSTLPKYATDGSAGLDLVANIAKELILYPGQTALIPTGLRLNIKSKNVVGMIYPRSGKGYKEGLVMANGTGVIDSDYRGEVFVAAVNRNIPTEINAPVMEGMVQGNHLYGQAVKIAPLERIAQLVFLPVIHANMRKVDQFYGETERGSGGFGSSGKM